MSERVDLKPIKIRDNGDARVAYDLMLVIAQAEGSALSESNDNMQQRQNNPRAYYANLYKRCINLVRNGE